MPVVVMVGLGVQLLLLLLVKTVSSGNVCPAGGDGAQRTNAAAC